MWVFQQKEYKHINIEIMNLEDFITKFAAQFDETESSVFKADTEFKALDEWSSMLTLSIIAMADEEYGVQLKGDDIRNSSTIEDLYKIVAEKAN